MVVVVGHEGRLVSSILRSLDGHGMRAHGGIPQDGEPSDLFALVTELGARAVVGVDRLRWWGDDGSFHDDALLDACLRACRAPSNPKLVWVTGDADSPEMQTIRRSGVPYVLVQAAPLLALDAGVERRIEGEVVLVPQDVPPPPRGVATIEAVADAVSDAVASESVGRVVRTGFSGDEAWCEAVAALGGRPRSVGPLRARAARLLGQPLLEVTTEHVAVRGLAASSSAERWIGDEPQAPPPLWWV